MGEQCPGANLGCSLSVTSPRQEERPSADIDVLVGACQAAAVLLQVVPGVLVEVRYLGSRRGDSGGHTSPTPLPGAR